MHALFRSAVFASVFVVSGGVAQALGQESGSTESSSWEDVSREAGELLDTLSAYGSEQRDDAVAASGEALDKVDAQIDELAHSMAENWDSMDAASREKSRAAMEALRARRTELAEWYGGMKHSSAGAWDEMKAGFSGAYRSLSDAWTAAAQEFEDASESDEP